MTATTAPTGATTPSGAHASGKRRGSGARPDARGGRTRLALGVLLRVALCLVFGLPLLFMVVSSFKPDLQIFGDLGSIKAFLPTGDSSADNYTGVFGRV